MHAGLRACLPACRILGQKVANHSLCTPSPALSLFHFLTHHPMPPSLLPLLTPLPAEVPLPEDLKPSVEAKRAELVEAVAEVDEELGEQFVLEEPIDGPMLRAAVRR